MALSVAGLHQRTRGSPPPPRPGQARRTCRRRRRPSRSGAAAPRVRPSPRHGPASRSAAGAVQNGWPSARERRAAQAHPAAAVAPRARAARRPDSRAACAAWSAAARPRPARRAWRPPRQIAVAVAQHAGDAVHRVFRRIVGDEVPDQLGGEEAMRLGMGGRKRSAATPPSSPGGKRRPMTICSPGSCAKGRKRKPGGSPCRSIDQPVSTRAKLGHVGLGVAGSRADRVQFQAFARQVLVQPALAALPGLAVRPDRAGVVEVEQHRGVAHRPPAACRRSGRDMRADRLLDECPASAAHARSAE